jgi:hypothetical protein
LFRIAKSPEARRGYSGFQAFAVGSHHFVGTPELARHHDPAIRIDGVNLKDLLRQIEPNARVRPQAVNQAHSAGP